MALMAKCWVEKNSNHDIKWILKFEPPALQVLQQIDGNKHVELFESFVFFRQQEKPEHRGSRLEKQRESDKSRR